MWSNDALGLKGAGTEPPSRTLMQARELRDRRVLRAPLSGVILERLVDPGQTVGLESVITAVADLSSPEVTIEVDGSSAEIRRNRGNDQLAGQGRL